MLSVTDSFIFVNFNELELF